MALTWPAPFIRSASRRLSTWMSQDVVGRTSSGRARKRWLDRNMLSLHCSVANIDTQSTLLTKRPICASLTKPALQKFTLFFAVCYVGVAVCHLLDLRKCTATGGEWTFSCLKQRGGGDGGLDCRGAGIQELFFTLHGAQVLPATTREVNGSLVATTRSDLPAFDGWCFLTSTDDPSQDAVQFLLESSTEGDARRPVASSAQFPRFAGGTGFEVGPFSTPEARGAPVCFSFCRDAWLHGALAGCFLVAAAGYLRGMYWARNADPDVARRIIGLSLLLVACTTLLFGLLALWRGSGAAAKEFGAIPTQLVFPLYTFLVDEGAFINCIYGVAVAGTVFSFATLELNDPQLALMLGFNLVLFNVAAHFHRATRRAVARARELVQPDKARYDAAWGLLLRTEGPELGRLRLAVLSTPASQVAEVVQMHLSEEGSPIAPVGSLDELYDGAHAADVLFVKEVQRWALEHDGMFAMRTRGTDGQLHFEHSGKLLTMEEAQKADSVKWARVKGVERSIEKLFRVYDGQVWYLVDLCRQNIVFETPRDLRACLEEILADPTVAVDRIKNRYDPGYDSELTAGYRDVVVNLRLVGSSSLTVREHICELQLLLRPFAALKHEEGHARYVQFRNLRGM